MARLSPAALATRTGLYVYLEPRLAMDHKETIDYTALVQGLTGRNFRARAPIVERAVKQAVRGKLAQDNGINDLAALLSALAPQAAEADQAPGMGQIASNPGGSAGPMGVTPAPDQGGSTQDIVAKIKAYLEQEGIPPEILNNLDAFLAEHQPNGGPPGGGGPPNGGGGPMGGNDRIIPPRQEAQDQESGETIEGEPGSASLRVMEPRGGDESDFTPESAEDEEPDPWRRETVGDNEVPDEQSEQMGGVAQVSSEGKPSRVVNGGGQDRMITKAAMDRAIQLAQDRAIKNQRAIREAERHVRPWVGDLAMDAAQPADIYRAALKALGVRGAERMHADALRPVLEAQPRPSVRVAQDRGRQMAQDTKVEGSFFDRFPDAKKITLQ